MCLSRSVCLALTAPLMVGVALGDDCPEWPLGATHKSVMDHFSKMTDRDAEPPHLWALSSHCFQQAFAPLTATHTMEDQAMIITGESGVSDPERR
jgi:hypothetical protein